MQNFALTAADKQLIKTFFITFIAVVAGLPVASALMPSRGSALAETPASVTRTAEEAGLGSCVTATGTGTAKKAGTNTNTREIITTHTNTVNTSSNNGGATAQVGRDGIAAAVNANVLNDVADVTVGDVSVPVLSGNNTNVNPSILSNNQLLNGNGNGLLGLGILGL